MQQETMAKFNLYAAESTILEQPDLQQAGAHHGVALTPFAVTVGLWFVAMFAVGCLILAS